jgi:cob(I)alamin adenosyltransferase
MVGEGFVKKKTNNDIHQCAVKSGLGFLAGINSPEFDVIILDEIIWAVYLNLISEEELFNFLTECIWKNQTVILTGRPLVKNIIDISDVVTEMKCEKHDFNSGTKAQLGIEF